LAPHWQAPTETARHGAILMRAGTVASMEHLPSARRGAAAIGRSHHAPAGCRPVYFRSSTKETLALTRKFFTLSFSTVA
jgi:hypothetical protein